MKRHFPAESEGLGPMVFADGSAIGIVEGVNDSSAELVEGFRPTRYELKVLARDYVERVGELEYQFEETDQSGSTQIRFPNFASARLNTIRKALGDQEFEGAIRSVKEHWEAELADLVENYPRCKGCGIRMRPEALNDKGLCDLHPE